MNFKLFISFVNISLTTENKLKSYKQLLVYKYVNATQTHIDFRLKIYVFLIKNMYFALLIKILPILYGNNKHVIDKSNNTIF